MAWDFERDGILPDGTTHQGRTPAHWRRVALLIAKRTGRAVGLETATRMVNRPESFFLCSRSYLG